MTGKDALFANGFRAGAQRRDLVRVEIALKVSEQVSAKRETGK